MPQPNDLSRSLVALDHNSTIIVVVELSQSSWLVGGVLPGIERQPRKKLSAAGTVLVRKGQVRAHAQHAPTPIRAGIAGSHPDLIRGPVLRRDQPQSRCGPAAIIAANKRSQRPRACANPASSPIAFRVA
jgi:hypothetical protein